MIDGTDIDKRFVGSIPEIYDTFLVPLIFEPYAIDIARHVSELKPTKVLEMAASTGAVTRELAKALPMATQIIATDLNPAMLDRARAIGVSRSVEWQQADAMHLPFGDAAFDVIVCQFDTMFFPDKPHAFAEMRRVLRPGGTLVFSVWDHIECNAFAHSIITPLARIFPDDPPTFLAHTPHAYHDTKTIERDLRLGGFDGDISIDTVTLRSRADSPRIPAIALCQGSPMRYEIEAHGSDALEHATDVCAKDLANAFSTANIDADMQAHVIVAAA